MKNELRFTGKVNPSQKERVSQALSRFEKLSLLTYQNNTQVITPINVAYSGIGMEYNMNPVIKGERYELTGILKPNHGAINKGNNFFLEDSLNEEVRTSLHYSGYEREHPILFIQSKKDGEIMSPDIAYSFIFDFFNDKLYIPGIIE